MKYFALFIKNEGYIEKCLLLIKHIGSPGSKSLPHITVRVMPNADDHPEYVAALQKDTVNHIDVIAPDTFNMNTSGPYVVFLQCESNVLEANNYKPDYPYSRLHLTLYEGKDYVFAKKLMDVLDRHQWNFKIAFQKPRPLSVRTIGVKQTDIPQYAEVFEDVLGWVPNDEWREDNNKRLELIEEILRKQDDYLRDHGNLRLAFASMEKAQFGKENVSPQMLESRIADGRLSDEIGNGSVYVTPPEYANDMARYALDAVDGKSNEIDFGDSSVGTGSLFIALDRLISIENARKGKKYRIKSAVGIDVDETVAKEALRRCGTRGLKVFLGDAVSDIDIGEKRNLMVVNPPYDRYHKINPKYREWMRETAKEITGIDIPRRAGLYVYHLLIMDKWLAEGGIGVWLLPASFLYTEYGMAVRRYLTENVQLLRLHIYDETKTQFTNAMISTVIVVFRKMPQRENGTVHISAGESIQYPHLESDTHLSVLQQNIENWRRLFPCDRTMDQNADGGTEETIRFSDLFDIKRGLATGANSFFVMKKELAVARGIPEIAWKPVLPKARYLKSQIIEATQDGSPCLAPQLVLLDCDLDESKIQIMYPQLYEYLQTAKLGPDGRRIVDRTLVKKRTPWYKQEKREPPLFLLTYMGRNKAGQPPLYFILNKSKAVALNTYLLLYPKSWLYEMIKDDDALCEQLLFALNDTAEKVISEQTRKYSGGLQKLEPNELKNINVIGLPNTIVATFMKN